MKTVRLSPENWYTIYQKIKTQHPPSVLLSREKMRRVLGFTPRQDMTWKYENGLMGAYDGYGDYHRSVCLDFFDEQKKTMFILKYGEYFDSKDQNS